MISFSEYFDNFRIPLYDLTIITIPFINGLIGVAVIYGLIYKSKKYILHIIGLISAWIMYGVFYLCGCSISLILMLLRES